MGRSRVVRWAILLGLALVLAAPAAAQGRGRGRGQNRADDPNKPPEPPREAKIGEEAPAIDAAFSSEKDDDVSLDKYRGRIVLLFFFRSDDTASLEALTALNKIHSELGNKGVVIIGLTAEKRDGTEGIVNDKQVKFQVGYEADLESSYKVAAVPEIYMIDPRGILTTRLHPADRLEERLKMQIALTPPAGADTQALQNRFAAARKWYSEGEYGKTYTAVKELRELVDTKSALGPSVSKLADEVEAAAKKWLDEAKKASSGDKVDKAVRILAELSVRFAGQDIAGEADNEIGRLMGQRELKTKLRDALENSRGELLNDQAALHEVAGRYLDARRLYRETTEEHPDSKASEAAAAAIARLDADPKAKASIEQQRSDAQAFRWLDIGDRFARAKMYMLAREHYQKVIDEYPKTLAGGKAKDRLTSLPKEDPPETQPVAAGEDDESSEPSKEPEKGKGATGKK